MNDSKICPHCGEEIMAVAKKCRHCGEWLDNNLVKDASNQTSASIIKPSKTSETMQFSKEKVLSSAIVVLGLLGITIVFAIGFHLWWLMVVGYILVCYGVCHLFVSSSKNPEKVKVGLIRVSAILNVVCLFISAYGFSYTIEIYIFDVSILYCLVFPLAIGLGVCTVLYSTLKKSEK